MRLNVIVLILFVMLCSCKETNKPTTPFDEPMDLNTDVSEVLVDGSNDLFSFKSYRSDDLVNKLFKEAMEKNNQLNKLTKRIENIPKINQDSIEAYQKHQRINQGYYNTALNYAGLIKDSIGRATMTEFIKSSKDNFNKSMSGHDAKLTAITKKSFQLNDQFIVMKLLITEKMLSNYQKENIPDIRSLEHLIKRYDELIEEAKEVVK